MSKFPLLCLRLFSSSFLFGQYDDLLKNPDISWVAEYTADFSLDPSLEVYNLFHSNNDLNVMQFDDTPCASGLFESNQNYGMYFSRKIVENMQKGTYSFFEDELFEIPIPAQKIQERMLSLDTVVTFDPETYEEKVRIVSGDFEWGLISGFRVRQVFFYNKTDKIFGSRLLAIAPLALPKDWAETMTNESKPLLWLKIELPKNAEKIIPKDVSYVFETKMRGNAPHLSDFVLKKGRMDFLSLITNEVARPSHVILNEHFVPIDPSKLQEFVLSVDTVRTFNPETYAEKTEIVQRNAIKDVGQINFVQQWFFDDRKRIFFNRVIAVAPLVAVKDEEGNFLHSKVLFYMLNK